MSKIFKSQQWTKLPVQSRYPEKYFLESLDEIPNGSIYFAQRSTKLSKIGEEISGQPLDFIGILFKTTAQDRAGIYIYGFDEDHIVTIKLSSLISDPTIIQHYILPLLPLTDAKQEIKLPRYLKGAKKIVPLSDFSEIQSSLVDVLKNIMTKYSRESYVTDYYSTISSIVGLPFSNFVGQNEMTGPKLVGLILWEAGLIWDDHYTIKKFNPVVKDMDFYQSLKTSHTNQLSLNLGYSKDESIRFSLPFDMDLNDIWSQININDYIIKGEDGSIDIDVERFNRDHYKLEKGDSSEGIITKKLVNLKTTKVLSPTILFGSLTLSDFIPQLNKKSKRWNELRISTKLNLSFWHDRLIPVEKKGQIKESSFQIQSDLENFEVAIKENYKYHLNKIITKKAYLKEAALLIGEWSNQIHELAIVTNAKIIWKKLNLKLDARDYPRKNKKPINLRLPVIGESTEIDLSLDEYMWNTSWKYYWTKKGDQELLPKVKQMIKEGDDILDLISEICPIYNVVLHLVVQLKRTKKYLKKYRED